MLAVGIVFTRYPYSAVGICGLIMVFNWSGKKKYAVGSFRNYHSCVELVSCTALVSSYFSIWLRLFLLGHTSGGFNLGSSMFSDFSQLSVERVLEMVGWVL